MAKKKTSFTKRGLHFVDTADMSREQWLKKRMDGIGGSDISSILGLNHRFPAVELFYQKVGFTKDSKEINEPMFWGTELEDQVLDKGQYIDVDTQEYIDNYLSKNKLREISKVPHMVMNPKYPWIIANLDGAVNFNKRTFMMDAIAEAKNISRQTAEMWESGIPPYHLIQIMTYAIVCEPLMTGQMAAYIFYLEDGRKFKGYRVFPDEDIIKKIIEESKRFWDLVLEGRDIMYNVKDEEKQLAMLSEIQPPPDGTKAYEDFLSELYKRKSNMVTIIGDEEMLALAEQYAGQKHKVKEAENKIQEMRNIIISDMYKQNASTIMLPDNAGKITYNGKALFVKLK